MIEHATIRFSNGNESVVEKVKFKDGSWIGVRANDGWVYYPPEQIGSVIDRDEEDSQ